MRLGRRLVHERERRGAITERYGPEPHWLLLDPTLLCIDELSLGLAPVVVGELIEIVRQLNEQGITVARSLVGNYITSLEMAGCSITLLKLDDEMTELWDAPVHTAALRWGV